MKLAQVVPKAVKGHVIPYLLFCSKERGEQILP
jgi:hypothetical protein